MSSDPTSAQPKSPILAAVGISLAVGLGAVLGTTDFATIDLATIEDAITGKWLTRPYVEAQQGHTVAIAALEQDIGGVSRDIDFVAARAGAAVRRNEDQAAARFAQIDAEIAALKDKLAGVQLTQLISRPDTLGAPGDPGLRSSLTELTAAHHNSVAAITRRLDRIEVKVGLTTDVATPVAASVRKPVRRAVKIRRHVAPPSEPIVSSPLDGGQLFNVRPVSQRTGMRLSRLPN